jgi:serine kinase of HPr protein (carbohydrate metabolism regulator)
LPDAAELVHGTCVALGRSAALLRGPSGSGKSDLALRFLFLARRGPAALEPPTLIADDQVRVRREGAALLVEAPPTLRGKLEVRGLGIVDMKFASQAELVLVVDLVAAASEVERMPDTDARVRLLGVDVPAIRLWAAEPSAPIKLALALARARKT